MGPRYVCKEVSSSWLGWRVRRGRGLSQSWADRLRSKVSSKYLVEGSAPLLDLAGGTTYTSAQVVVCESRSFFVGRAVKQRVETNPRQHTGRGTGRGGAGLALLLACRGLSSVPAASCWRSQVSRGLP